MNTTMLSLRGFGKAILLSFALVVPAMHAQSARNLTRVTVPFAFEYGKHEFPAGQYTLGMTTGWLMSVRGQSGAAFAVVMSDESENQKGPGRLVFRRVGTEYALADLYLPGSSTHIQCPVSKPARRRELVQVQPGSPYVQVALDAGPR